MEVIMKKLSVKSIPPEITPEEMLLLMKGCIEVTEKLRELDVKMSFGIVNNQIINNFRMHEAIESTRIEGTQTTMQEIFEAKIDKKDNQDIREVLNYLEALREGNESVMKDGFIASRTLKMLHKALLKGDVRGSSCDPGEFRKIDNWIGPVGSSKENACYIPPSNIYILDYMKNLEDFINNN